MATTRRKLLASAAAQDFVTLGSFEAMFSTELQKPPGANFREWLETAQFKV